MVQTDDVAKGLLSDIRRLKDLEMDITSALEIFVRFIVRRVPTPSVVDEFLAFIAEHPEYHQFGTAVAVGYPTRQGQDCQRNTLILQGEFLTVSELSHTQGYPLQFTELELLACRIPDGVPDRVLQKFIVYVEASQHMTEFQKKRILHRLSKRSWRYTLRCA